MTILIMLVMNSLQKYYRDIAVTMTRYGFNTASAMTYSPDTSAPSTLTVPAKAPIPNSSSASPSPTVAAMTSILPAYDKPSASTLSSQPILHPTHLVHSSPRTIPATQAFIRGHHGSQLTLFSPRRLRSDTSKKTFRSIR